MFVNLRRNGNAPLLGYTLLFYLLQCNNPVSTGRNTQILQLGVLAFYMD